MTDPLSLFAVAITLASIGARGFYFAFELREDYKDAEIQIETVQYQYRMLQEAMKKIPLELLAKMKATKDLFEAIENNFPETFPCGGRKDRWLWAIKRKRKAEKVVDQLGRIENAIGLVLHLENAMRPNESQSTLVDREAHEGELRNRGLYPGLGVTTTPLQSHAQNRNNMATRGDARAIRYPGSSFGLVVSNPEGVKKYDGFMRLRFMRWKLLSCRITGTWSSWSDTFRLSRLRVQNIISPHSDIANACHTGDDSRMQTLFDSGKARPNDTTEENLTLLYFAIRAGKPRAVQLLLDMGADPNLTFGRWETSPIQTAFYYGNTEIVRKLLLAGAELDYVNRRKWTSARYLHDPQRSNQHTIELLEIYAFHTVEQWNSVDAAGWTILHRAAAFGNGADVKRLLCLGASDNSRIQNLSWLPLQCAARYGNKSTFEVLSSQIRQDVVPSIKDSRGWTLLHLAVQNGSQDLIEHLLRCGLDPSVTSSPSSSAVPASLKHMKLTAMDIAEACGSREAYQRALGATGSVTALGATGSVTSTPT